MGYEDIQQPKTVALAGLEKTDFPSLEPLEQRERLFKWMGDDGLEEWKTAVRELLTFYHEHWLHQKRDDQFWDAMG